MIDDSDWKRLARYLAGECTPDEASATRQWITRDAERQALFELLEHAWMRTQQTAPSWDSMSAWRRVAARAVRPDRVGLAVGVGGSPSLRGLRFAAAIAASAIAALGIAGVRHFRGGSTDSAKAAPAPPPHEREYRTAAGQRAIVNLADGTRVELGVESTLRVRAWTTPSREVFLEGEAAFTVVHDSTRPFLVHARDALAEDLGTRFAVRAYLTDARVHVVVMSGEVAFGPEDGRGPKTVLHAGDDASFDAGRVVVAGADTAAVLGWTRERFVVRAMPLRDVARQLERWFDVRIEISDSVAAASRVTINMPATRLTDILGAATTPLGLLYTQTGRVIVIRRPRARADDSVPSRRSDP